MNYCELVGNLGIDSRTVGRYRQFIFVVVEITNTTTTTAMQRNRSHIDGRVMQSPRALH